MAGTVRRHRTAAAPDPLPRNCLPASFEMVASGSGTSLGPAGPQRPHGSIALPQDLKVEVDRLTHEEALAASRYLAGVVGAAHGRQMAPRIRKEWRAVLRRGRSSRLDAPSWLWSSVVALASTHEAAYLEHCRRYARGLERV